MRNATIVGLFSGFGVLSGCEAGIVSAAMLKVLLWIGQTLIASGIGYTLEVAMDKLFAQEQVISSSIRDVQISNDSPLVGYVTHPLRVDMSDFGSAMVINRARVVRTSISSQDWKVDPDLIAEIRAKARSFNK